MYLIAAKKPNIAKRIIIETVLAVNEISGEALDINNTATARDAIIIKKE
ncbi:hypothetical protein [Ferruginibacter sp.]|nr:hypothetical protein [Ferruginibacter sp.]